MSAADAPPERVARAVEPASVAGWFVEGMRLFKRAPGAFLMLAAITLATQLACNAIPLIGAPLGAMLIPLVASGMLYASLAADRGERVSVRFVLFAFGAPTRCVAALLLAALIELAVEAGVAAWIAGVNIFDPSSVSSLGPSPLFAMYLAGIAASLPLMFVPFAALFDGDGIRDTFAASFAGFARNPLPLLLYGAASFLLLLFGALTFGTGLLIALPLWATSSYAAWKHVFAVGAAVPYREGN